MHELDDHALLREYVEQGSDEAFATLVTRHLDKVYSVALRQTGNPHSAEEITQAVFVILAKKSRQLDRRVILSGWLYETARLTAITFNRSEIRRAHREQEAYMQTMADQTGEGDWPRIAPLLDAAMAGLNETDRHAVVLRFFDGKSMREVAVTLGANEITARKRVNRAVERLRRYFTKRGILLPAAVLAAAISTHSVQAAPATLAKSVTTLALAKGAAASGSTLTLIQGAMKLMAWTKMKMTLIVGFALMLALGTTSVVMQEINEKDDLFWDNPDLGEMTNPPPPALVFRPTHYPDSSSGTSTTSYDNNWFVGRSIPLCIALEYAYDRPLSQMILPSEFINPRQMVMYDVLVSVANHPREKLQAKIKKKLGLTIQPAVLDTDVWLLQLKNPDAPGLKNADYPMAIPFTNLVRGASEFFGKPIVDQTGLTGRYNYSVNWPPYKAHDPHYRQEGIDAYKQAWLDQLGLEFVPTNQPFEMLVVTKAK